MFVAHGGVAYLPSVAFADAQIEDDDFPAVSLGGLDVAIRHEEIAIFVQYILKHVLGIDTLEGGRCDVARHVALNDLEIFAGPERPAERDDFSGDSGGRAFPKI
jgi:hypothetical protein